MSSIRFGPDHPVLRTPAIWHPDRRVRREGYTIVLFRRRFELDRPRGDLRLWVTASQRYLLYLDGRLISRGPSRSDPQRWGVMAVELGELSAGGHVLAARVVHFGSHAGMGQMGAPGFFLLHAEAGDGGPPEGLDTSEAWRCMADRSRSPIARHAWGGKSPYDVIGAGERIDGAKLPWGWQEPGFDDADWPRARIVCRAAHNPWGHQPLGRLRPDPLGPMEHRDERFSRVADVSEGYEEPARGWLEGRPWTLPPSARVRVVLDRGALTNAYPALTVSGGRGSRIRMVTAEAPYERARAKVHRDDAAGRRFFGHVDEFLPDGGADRVFATLWFRSLRYVELTIRTGDEPLSLGSFSLTFTGYPMRQAARFEGGGEPGELCRRMWDVSWWTARLCAHETFFDCPHYEQAQFVGDTRVQAVYHYAVAGDDRLARKAIEDFHASRIVEGLTQSRFPSREVQVLPTFSLHWIGMLHDFRVWRGDVDFLTPHLHFAREIASWFLRRRRGDGMLGFIEYAPFTDWTPGFEKGNAPQDADGGSSILTLLLAAACGWLASLEKACGYPELAPRWEELHRSLTDATLTACWDQSRGLLADTPTRQSFSLHAQVQAILAGAWPQDDARAVLDRALGDESLTQVGTLYYRYYVAQAMKACGLGDRLFELLESWRKLLEGTGLTTWPEKDVNPRSDCHAWSVTPAIELLRTVLGVEPDAMSSGFGRLRFEPALGPLPEADGTVPTPRGEVHVRLRREGDTLRATLQTPVEAWIPVPQRTLPPGRHELAL